MKTIQISFFLLSIISLFSTCFTFGQSSNQLNDSKPIINSSYYFSAHPSQKYGFDALEHNEWKVGYRFFNDNKLNSIYASYKSVNYNETDFVQLVFKSKNKREKPNFKLFIGTQEIQFSKYNDSTYTIELPKKETDYILKTFVKDEVVAKLYVHVFKVIKEKIIIVPISPFNISPQKIQENLNSIYKQANIQFDVSIGKTFKSKVFESSTIYSTPKSNQFEYTGQMRLLRDMYFESFPKMDKKAHYVFVIKGFEDSLLNGFMAKNKSLDFIKSTDDIEQFTNQLAHDLGFGVGGLKETWVNNGPLKGSTFNLMDSMNKKHLTFFQWTSLRSTPNYYSYYDDDENIQTNSGTIAYYFWEEDAKGNIVFNNHGFFQSLKRPYKHNFLSYRFKVKYFILRPFYKIWMYYISIIDLIFLAVTVLVLWYIRKKLKQFWTKKKYRFIFLRRLIFLSIILFNAYQVYENYWVTNRILSYFKQVSGPLEELGKVNYFKAKIDLLENDKLLHEDVPTVCSEILIRKNKRWYLKKRSKVLYFDVRRRGKGPIVKARFVGNSDSLILTTLNYHKRANSHFIVVSTRHKDGTIEKQEVFDYKGNEVSSKFQSEDPPKRILLFVNGYRPTSIGQTFEENFQDVQVNGLEYPNSKNFIYDFDRYDYWQPWNEINLLFQKRINPSNTYYADGHFSVSSSNYRSLINFSNIATMYPKKCVNSKKHTCYSIKNPTIQQYLFSYAKTINQLKMRPNRVGFNLRKANGKIAGKNLLQIINENPEFSKNDTLYIVAHSMGFAYSQGMIEVLRGKINFGGYYVIAPENGKSGKINNWEWKEVWQYGSNFNTKNPDAPCLQDGIAPQCKVPGLPSKKQVFIPKSFYFYKGFYNSHFIGFYTWVLRIEEGKPGYIMQR